MNHALPRSECHLKGKIDVQDARAMRVALAWLLPAAAAAEPIKLKMAYFSSDRTTTYLAAIKPFVDAVNAEAAGLVQIDVSLSGTLGKNPTQQLQLVLDGTADLAFVSRVIRRSGFRTTR